MGSGVWAARPWSTCSGVLLHGLSCMWDLPRTVTEPTTPALAGRFFTIEPPGSPPSSKTLYGHVYHQLLCNPQLSIQGAASPCLSPTLAGIDLCGHCTSEHPGIHFPHSFLFLWCIVSVFFFFFFFIKMPSSVSSMWAQWA